MAKNGASPRKRGRPSIGEQELIKRKIRPYYDDNYSARYTAQQTGHDWKTIQAYFREWTEQAREQTDFVYQQQEAKDRLVSALDRRIKTYMEQIERIEKQIRKKSTIGLESLLAQVNRNLSTLLLDKAGVIITPTLDVQISQILRDKYQIDIDELKEAAHANGR